ncbi:outer dynein arm-docking complex subunit 3 [Neodiprion pinetum]|uniref:outer dynein arm-docking complex subunit 3 n=1 Tax=Neodiprion pinetum TaxID=441929 RepID=UPI001EDCB9B5|nr:myosin-4 [Neodiprion pinetum]
MADPLVQTAKESKLTALNKKIIEIKKKIQLSEGQRKACFEECDAQKKENAEKVARLKKEVKELQVTFAKAKNTIAWNLGVKEMSKDAEQFMNLFNMRLTLANVRVVKRVSNPFRHHDNDILNLLFMTKEQEAADTEALRGQDQSLSSVKRKNLAEAIAGLDEDIIRLRKKLDLIRYESDKQQKKLTGLLQEYEELMSGTVQKFTEQKVENPVKKKIIRLENQLQRIHVMQMEADTVRKKYRGVRSSLKADAALYASSLQIVEEQIQEQKSEIRRLQDVKEEAIHLRDITKGTLMKQEVEAMNTSKQRDGVILDYRFDTDKEATIKTPRVISGENNFGRLSYGRRSKRKSEKVRQYQRQRVEDRRLELERLERMIFPTGRPVVREDSSLQDDQLGKMPGKESTQYLEESFDRLKDATGVSRTEDVLNRFLSQKATKDKLQKMRVAAENEKITLERKRQQLMAEIEKQKFSETKDSEQNAEELEHFNRQIAEQVQRQEKALTENKRVQELLMEVNSTLWLLCDKLRDVSLTPIPEKVGSIDDVFELLDVLQEKVEATIELAGILEKNVEVFEDLAGEQIETVSTSASEDGKMKDIDDRPFFPTFPSASTPAAPAPPSEDEEEVPTRSVLKRQAQLLVDTKSRRKGFNFRR